MENAIVCGLEPTQIIAYLKGEKDCEVRKSLPNPEARLKKPITKVDILIKTKGGNICLVARADEVIRDKPSKLWKLNETYKLGISKTRFDQYFQGYRGEGVLIHFSKIEMIDPPLVLIFQGGLQTWRYGYIPPNTNRYSLSNSEIQQKLIKYNENILKAMEK